MKIGVFDSGLGGLAILADIKKQLPAYDYFYLGDNRHFPYGNKNPDQITTWLKKIIPFFVSHNCQLIIFACNTATATSLPIIQDLFSPQGIKVLGVVRPTTEFLAENNFSQVGIIGTTNTIKANIFPKDWQKVFSNRPVHFYQVACPGLAESIEADNKKDINNLLSSYLGQINKNKIEILVLGCTHYGLVIDLIRQLVEPTGVVGQGEIVAQKLTAYLSNHPEVKTNLSLDGQIELAFTKEDPHYLARAKLFLKKNKINIRLAKIFN